MAISGILDALDSTTPEGRKLIAEIEKFNSMEAVAGFPNGPDDVVAIAAYNEFGTSTIPPRPFIQQTMSKHEGEISETFASAVAQVMSGATAEDALNQIGKTFKEMIQAEISSGDFVPNAPETVAKKGSSTPLIDTGRMRDSVDYMVRTKG